MMRFASAVFLGLLSATCALAQPSPFNGRTEWTGTVRYEGRGSGTHSNKSSTETWSISRGAEMRVRLKWEPDLGLWQGPVLEGRGSINDRITTTTGKHTSVRTLTAEVDLSKNIDGEPRIFQLHLRRDGSYQPSLLDDFVDGRFVTEAHDRIASTPLLPYDVTEELWQKAPSDTSALRGRASAKGWIPMPTLDNVRPDWNVHIEWDLRSGDAAPEDEVVITSADYAEWRPQAGIGGSKGNDIAFKAVLQKKGGGEPSQKAVRFEWKFTDVSREPGYTMNVPIVDANRQADLRFESSQTLLVTDEEGQKAETPSGLLTESDAVIASFDWGGFGAFEVTAVLEDGRQIKGRMPDAGEPTVLLPKRAPGDFIAASWRKAKGAFEGADWDGENEPVGDGNRGDGFTLYEEYRGFMENGTHIEGDTRRKDYFILHKAGSDYLPGIKQFAHISELAVHAKLLDSEFHESHVMNFNFGQGPHKVAQHGVKVIADAAYIGAAEAKGGPGQPRFAYVPPVFATDDADVFKMKNSSLAHELLHTCNVYHHGDRADRYVWWKPAEGGTALEIRSNANGDEIGSGSAIRVLREDGTDITARMPAQGLHVRLGMQQGPHSGPDNCVMRYDIAGGYISQSKPEVRYRVIEKVGMMLCRQALGTGVNEFGRSPQPRYGDSDVARGVCFHQILVNDAVAPPVR